MAYSAGYRINDEPNGDTVSEAFSKVKAETERVYGILNELKNNDLTPSELENLKTGYIDGSRVTGTIRGYVDGSHVTGTINGGLITGALTQATIGSGKVTGLEAFVKGLLPREEESSSDKGDGITSSSLSKNGYVKYNNGFMLQWGVISLINKTGTYRASVTFPTPFTSNCLAVIPSGGIIEGIPTLTGFEVFTHDTDVYANSTYYIAIGV